MTPTDIYRFLITEQSRLQNAMDEIEDGSEKESLVGQWAMAKRIVEKFKLDEKSKEVH